MYELNQVSEHCYFFQAPAKVGLVVTDGGEAFLIDSGNDRDAGKRVKRCLDAHGWALKAIYNTHSHADHVGGNRYLQQQTGCKVYASAIEQAFTEHPLMEPTFLYGANPPKDLRHKFLIAQESDVLPLSQECLPEGMSLFPLPGHSWNMVGYRTSEGIVYLADCLSSATTVEKYGISFLVDVAAYLQTLEAVQRMEGKLFVPAHAEPTSDIVPLARLNIAKVHEVGDAIVDICARPTSFEPILRTLFKRYQLRMTFEQHALVGSTVRSYLTWLTDVGRLHPLIDDDMLLWEA